MVVVLLITHAQTELTVATIGCIAAALMSLVTLLTSGRKAAAGLFARVDYKTLLFFTGLFVVVAGLERTGCLGVLADGIARLSGGKAVVMVAIILWVSAVASAFVDNIPFAATMVPVIQAMAQTQGVGHQERAPRDLGQVLPVLCAGYHHGNGGVYGVHRGAVHVNRKKRGPEKGPLFLP